MATKKKQKSKPKPKTQPKRRIPRQDALPGMGDAKMAAIETTALDYAEIWDRRQELTAQESSLKTELLTLMHKAGKTEYRRNGISVQIEVEKEKVKVRVKEDGEEIAPPKKDDSEPEEVNEQEEESEAQPD